MTTTPPPTRPHHRPYTLLFDLILHTKLLDALDVCALGQCNKELREACTAFWLKNASALEEQGGEPPPDHLLRSAFRAVREQRIEARRKNILFSSRVEHFYHLSLQNARPCVVCLQTTRFQHPLLQGTMMCTPCSEKVQRADLCWSPLVRYKIVTEPEARWLFILSPDVRLDESLPYDVQVAGARYTRGFAASVKGARAGRRAEDDEAAERKIRRVFLLVDVACMVLEIYGGPRLLHERLCNLDRGRLCLGAWD